VEPRKRDREIASPVKQRCSDFGSVDIIVDRFMPVNIVYVGDPEYCSLAYLRPMATEVMAKTADGQKRMIIVEWGLRVKSQYSFAAIADLT
jgi:hypothetical protein